MHVLIVGAGIAGLTAAIALRHKGIDATIIEQAPQLSE
ncbi:FAD-dependent oxidoreductase, partial [Alloalcanivorax venustensis]